MHLSTLLPPLLALLSTPSVTATSDPPTTPYIATFLTKWSLQTLGSLPLSLPPNNTPNTTTTTFTTTTRHKRSPSSLLTTPNTQLITYPVPSTHTTLYIRLSNTLVSQNALMVAIAATYETVSKMIEDPAIGNIPLPLEAEPLYINPAPGVVGGVYVLVQSRPPLHLTFGMVENAMQGLWDVLIGRGRFLACRFEIWEEGMGYVGDGSLVAI